MMTPAFSVIVIAHNQYHFIRTALASVLGSDEDAIEVICIDDASTDGTAAVLDEMARADARVRVVHHPRCGRPSILRNAGLALARGEWISFLDGDDLYDLDRFPMLRAAMARHGPPADMVFHNHVVFRDGEPLAAGEVRIDDALASRLAQVAVRPHDGDGDADATWRFDGDRLGLFLLSDCFVIHTSSICIRRRLLEARQLRYDEGRTFGEDHPFMLSAVIGSSVAYVPAVLSYYRRHRSSLTATRSAETQRELIGSMLQQSRLLEDRTTGVVDPPSRTRIDAHLLGETLHLGYLLERRGERPRALRTYLGAAVRFRSARGLVRAVQSLIRTPRETA